MTLSYNWLHQYLPEKIEPNRLSKILTSVGLEVESMDVYEKVKGGMKGLVIGEVLSCQPHPDADKLKVTTVNIGADTPLNIVCGAPNVAVGQKVVVATVGATLYPLHGDSFQIKKAKIRGQESEGMLCAEDEIGLGEGHDGIIGLANDIAVGIPASDYYQLPEADTIYEIGLTPNRMDAMSHFGVAKDVCAFLSNERFLQHKEHHLRMQIPEIKATAVSAETKIELEIDSNLCQRYAGICIKNITVTQSPEWLQQRLLSVGLKPINCIVDISNYVMLECGQPLHAFDLHRIVGGKIKVGHVPGNTIFTALDGKEIKLHEEDIIISDAEKPVCIAGVYGGINSGVTTTTNAIFLESAWFNPGHIRKTSVRHGLRTDAATRFEKGVDISQTLYALHRAAQLIIEIAGGEISSQTFDHYPEEMKPVSISLQLNKLRSLAGKDYSTDQIKNILLSLCFSIQKEEKDILEILVPYSKPDIALQADIVEEIMRIDGIDNIPFTGKIKFSLPEQQGYKPNVKESVAQQLVAKGFFELFTNSISNSQYYPENNTLVHMLNSLSANLDVMRPSMLESGLEAIAYNLNRKNTQLKFFEFGKVYWQQNNRYQEEEKLVLYFAAKYRLEHYSEKSKQTDLLYAKGIIESVFVQLKPEFKQSEEGTTILFQHKKAGTIKEVEANKLSLFSIKEQVLYAELDWSLLKTALENFKSKFKEIPRFPVVYRDLAMIVKKEILYNDIQVAVKQAKCKLLQEMKLFDIFEHEKIGNENISYAVNFSFYDPTKTLTDSEIESEMKLLITSLEKKVGAVIRSN